MIAGPRVRIDDAKSFQMLKTTLHRRLVDAVDFSRVGGGGGGELGKPELHDQLQALATYLCAHESVDLPAEWRERMVGAILDEIFGYGPLEALMRDPAVSDILVNGPDNVRVERNGLLQEADVRFADSDHVLRLIHRLLAQAGGGRRIDQRSPMVEARLPDGSRLTAVIPPLSTRGPVLSIRRRRSNALQFDDLVRLGTLTPEMSEFLVASVFGRLNILISGGGGAGKTTLLENLCRAIPHDERIVCLERTAELRFEQPDVVSLETARQGEGPADAPGRTPRPTRNLLANSLRLRPDRIVVGDARGSEALELLQAMTTGHDGSMSTVHANDPRDALARIELMIGLSGCELPLPVIRSLIASAVQIVVHVARLVTGERKVVRISELCGAAGDEYRLEDIFVYRMAGTDDRGQMQGVFYSTGHEPAALARLAALGVECPPNWFVPRELTAAPAPGPSDVGSR